VRPFTTGLRLAASAAFALAAAAGAVAAPPSETDSIPPGGSYHDCHGYVQHVSLENIRVHCIDGVAKDLSFLSWPKFVNLPSGQTEQTKSLKPGTPVHVVFSQSLGVRHAYKIYVADPQGHGLYGFMS
jgi:hypothetical protein